MIFGRAGFRFLARGHPYQRFYLDAMTRIRL
jgi:hypothetical protein